MRKLYISLLFPIWLQDEAYCKATLKMVACYQNFNLDIILTVEIVEHSKSFHLNHRAQFFYISFLFTLYANYSQITMPRARYRPKSSSEWLSLDYYGYNLAFNMLL